MLYSAYHTQIPAEFQASVGAGDVVEAISVQAADFYVLHRLGLHRHVGGLRPAGRDQCRGSSKKKALRLVHVEALSFWPRHRRLRANLVDVDDGDVSSMIFATGCCRNAAGGRHRHPRR
jgi:hypothetical protein